MRMRRGVRGWRPCPALQPDHTGEWSAPAGWGGRGGRVGEFSGRDLIGWVPGLVCARHHPPWSTVTQTQTPHIWGIPLTLLNHFPFIRRVKYFSLQTDITENSIFLRWNVLTSRISYFVRRQHKSEVKKRLNLWRSRRHRLLQPREWFLRCSCTS